MIPQNAVINVLPKIGNPIQVFMTYTDPVDYSFSSISVTSLELLYGTATLVQPNQFIAIDTAPLAILVTGGDYISILYVRPVNQQFTPDNFARIVQKIPKGIFTNINNSTIVGNDMAARALMADDYYQQYFDVINQVYSTTYSSQLEYQYNGTIGLLSNSFLPNELFHWFSSLGVYSLNAYNLELLISKYIYFRIGIECPVYINDHINNPSGFWSLDNSQLSLDGIYAPGLTRLAPDDFTPVLENLAWTIYNSASFTAEFQIEIQNLVNRISRADLGNPVTFSSIVDPTDDGFILIGPTYFGDPRLLDGKCILYTNSSNFPINIIGYERIFSI